MFISIYIYIYICHIECLLRQMAEPTELPASWKICSRDDMTFASSFLILPVSVKKHSSG